MTAAPFHPDASSALLPAALPYFEYLTERGLVHRYALHHRSSQAFALNLFAPLDAEGVAELFHAVGFDAMPTESVEFEYSDPSDRLAEARPQSAHRTQVDVVLRGTSPSGNRVVLLVEIKFTEVDFGWCSAYENSRTHSVTSVAPPASSADSRIAVSSSPTTAPDAAATTSSFGMWLSQSRRAAEKTAAA